MRYILLGRLGVVSLLLVLLVRCVGVRTRFINMVNIFKNKFILGLLDKMGISWINYNRFPDEVRFYNIDEGNGTIVAAEKEFEKIRFSSWPCLKRAFTSCTDMERFRPRTRIPRFKPRWMR